MAKRLVVLIFLLALRLILGGMFSRHCRNGEQVRLQGNPSYISQTDTNRIIYLGDFVVPVASQTKIYPGDGVTLIGTCRNRVIRFLIAQTELESGQIETISPKTVPENFFATVRGKLAARLQRQLPELEAGLVAGVTLGAKTSLTRQFYDQLINTGTVQIVVASGYNLSLVAIFLSSILWWFLPKHSATLLLVLALWLYAQLTGGEPPVQRAWLMTSLVLAAPLLGRRLPGWYVFCLSLWLILFFDPAMVESISFQLSAAATGGLIFLGPMIGTFFASTKLDRFLGAFSADATSTMAAQITTAPLIFWHFGRVAWLAPLTNTLIAPLIAPLTVVGFLNLAESFLLPYGGMVTLSTLMLSRSVIALIELFG